MCLAPPPPLPPTRHETDKKHGAGAGNWGTQGAEQAECVRGRRTPHPTHHAMRGSAGRMALEQPLLSRACLAAAAACHPAPSAPGPTLPPLVSLPHCHPWCLRRDLELSVQASLAREAELAAAGPDFVAGADVEGETDVSGVGEGGGLATARPLRAVSC